MLLFILWTFVPHSVNIDFSGGQNPMNRRGQSVFRSIHFEVNGQLGRGPRWLRNSETGAALTYHAIRQARSWFGYSDGYGNDHVRAESLYLFVRRKSRFAFFDIGTGPMWSNRRVPAATSRLNLDSEVSLGVMWNRLRLGYRYSHISNGGIVSRNPGLNVNSFFIGVQARRLR